MLLFLNFCGILLAGGDDMSITSERLKQAISEANIKQAELCERTGISKGALSSYISGRYAPKQNNIYILAQVLNVNPAWLMGLSVPKSPDVTVSRALTKEQRELLSYFDVLTEEGKNEAIKRIKELSELEQYKLLQYTFEEYKEQREDIQRKTFI